MLREGRADADTLRLPAPLREPEVEFEARGEAFRALARAEAAR
jgi:hypothetical protein